MKRWQVLRIVGIVSILFLLVQFFLWFRFPFQKEQVTQTINAKKLVKKILEVWNHLEGKIFVIEPDILYKILEQQNYSDNEDKCAVFCHITNKALALGIFGQDGSAAAVLSMFRRSGFSAFDAKEDNPDSGVDGAPERIITHIFLQHMEIQEPTIHIVVFYKRSAGFLWTSQIQMPTSDLSYGTTANAFDEFEVRTLYVDGMEISVPEPTRHFLHQKKTSTFLECDSDRANMFYRQYAKDESEKALHFQRKARQLLSKGKTVLDNLGIPFWISSGTVLGWYRQCDIIPYSNDVDFGIRITDYKPELIDHMEKAGLPLKHVFGKVSDSYELSFKAGEVKLDIFYFYKEGDTMWNGGTDANTSTKYKYIFPKFDLCWTTLLDLKVRVPCPTLPYIEANYGKNWSIPVKTWSWKNSPPNVRTNGVWPKSEWKNVVQVYE